jgi:hypothetical protein
LINHVGKEVRATIPKRLGLVVDFCRVPGGAIINGPRIKRLRNRSKRISAWSQGQNSPEMSARTEALAPNRSTAMALSALFIFDGEAVVLY